MGILIGTITSPDLNKDERIVRSAAMSVSEGTESTTTIFNLPGCCMGRVSFVRERSPEARIVKKCGSGLMWTGYITDMDRLRDRLKDAGTVRDGISDAEILFEIYFKFGIEGLQGLNGLYSIVIWDNTQRRFSAVTDRYGFTKIYYWLGPDGLMFASECRAILQHPEYQKGIDKEGIVNFMGAGYCFGGRTLFRDIKLVPQGCVLEYDGKALSLRKYWDYSVKPVAGDINEYTDKFYYHLTGALERCVNGGKNVFIPISGGLDSRTIAGVAHDCNKSIFGCTVGHSHSRDVCYGRKIGKRVCVRYSVLPISSNYMAQYGSYGVKLSEGTVSNHVFFTLRILDFNAPPDFMVSGFLGDVLSGKNLSAGMSDSEEIKRLKFLNAFDCGELDNMLDNSLKSLIGINSEYWNKSLKSADAEAFTDKLMINALQERQRRYAAFLINYLGREFNAVAPFADNQLMDFMMSIPPELRIEQKLYKNMIQSKLPLVADIPMDRTGKRLRSTWWSWRWENLKKIVPNNIKQKFRTADSRNWVVDFNYAIRDRSAPYFRDLFSDREHMAGLFNMDAVDRLLRSHIEGRVSEFHKLCAIATLIEWRRQFKL